MLNDDLWVIPSEPQVYSLARYLKDPVPNREKGDEILKNLTSVDAISMEFVSHFFACCQYIAQNQSSSSVSSSKTDDASSLANKTLNKIELIQAKGGLNSDDQGVEMRMVRNNSRSSEGSSSGFEDEGSEKSSSPQERLEKLQKFKMEDQYFEGKLVSPMKKAWLAIMRIDGGFGQLLGASLSKGLDGTKSWIASYLVWNRNTSVFMKNGIKNAIDDLKALIERLHPTELQDEYAIHFIIEALDCLYQKNNRFIQEGNASTKDLLGGEVQQKALMDLLGTLIPLHCGHNGWPSELEMEMISSWFEAIETVISGSNKNISMV